MDNLNDLGVLEMDAEDLQNNNGGIIQFAAFALAAAGLYYGMGEAIGKAWRTYENS
jgi:hypothetical protein